jgi:hypothetical protein
MAESKPFHRATSKAKLNQGAVFFAFSTHQEAHQTSRFVRVPLAYEP